MPPPPVPAPRAPLPLPAALLLLVLTTAHWQLARCQPPPPRNLIQIDEELLLGLQAAINNWDQATSSSNCSSVGGTDWVSGLPVCGNATQGMGWRGVVCDGGGHITEVHLEHCGLQGSLPDELAQLPHLAVLDLSLNALTGGVPVTWTAPGAFPALETLNLAGNMLSGALDDFTMASQGCMAGLALNVSVNAFSGGPIPAGWYSRTLTTMDLSFNGVSGPLPVQWGLPKEALGMQFPSSFPSLASLYVQGNNLSGPADPWPGGGAAVFSPDFIAVTQPGNEELQQAPPPPALDDADVALSGDGSAAQRALLAQRAAITNWAAFAGSNNVTGWDDATPVCLWTGVACSNGTVLQLDFGCNEVGAPQASGLCRTRAEGSLAPDLATISTMQGVFMTSQSLSGTLPPEWGIDGAFPALQKLDLCYNSLLSGTLPAQWGQPGAFRQLTALWLCDNILTGDLPAGWGSAGAFPVLFQLYLQSNRLSGTLPADWANMTNLSLLSIEKNSLRGALPSEWGSANAFAKLQQLSLDTNQLSGPLPASWGSSDSFPALQQLWLYHNNFTGTIPPAWSNGFWALQILDLHNCSLSGTLPASWGIAPNSFPVLEELWLNDNNLTGQIPEAWAVGRAYLSLGKMGLDDNPTLCGPVPAHLLQPVCWSGATQCTASSTLACPSQFRAADSLDALTPAPEEGGEPIPAGAIAGTVVGALAVGLLAGLGLFAWRRSRTRRLRQRAAAAQAQVERQERDNGAKAPGGGGFPAKGPAGAPPPLLDAAPGAPNGGGGGGPGEAASLPGSYVTSAGAWSMLWASLRGVRGGAAPGATHGAGPRTSAGEEKSAGDSGGSLQHDPIICYITQELASMRSITLDAAAPPPGSRHGLSLAAVATASSAAAPAAAAAGASGRAGPGSREAAADRRMMELWQVQWEELRLERMIGRGSFGFVYLAYWHETAVAAKVLIMSDDPAVGGLELPQATLRSLQEEAAVMCRMRHPNVVAFLGLVSLPPCIVTEWCSRGSLYDVLRRAGRDERVAAELSWQLRMRMAVDAATGLLYLHCRSPPIIHRDVKSPNLLVDEGWRVKVADFNLSKILASEQPQLSTSGGVGNPVWLAPEVLEGQRATAAADVYAFGLVLYELLVWDIPWRLPPFTVMRLVVGGSRPEIPAPEALPGPDRPQAEDLEAYCQLLRECWAQEPEARPTFQGIVPRLRQLLHAPGDLGAADSLLLSGYSSALLTSAGPGGQPP